ncbi:hypothetical protein [Marinilactibacillus psychrotolerans]|uniref:hypothetical protein n=1 Tax=Marinilactibacillus psychrotolerans TaxID=191770 RepID=UPI0038881856
MYYNWKENPKIINYIHNKYPNGLIKNNIPSLILYLEKQDLIADISDFSFFYQPDEELIEKELIKYGLVFELSDNMDFTKNDSELLVLNQKKLTDNSHISALVFNHHHPESFYASTRNITEMKLSMMDNNIYYTKDNVYYEIFKKENTDIEHYFSMKIRRRGNIKNDNTGALIKYNTSLIFEKLHYRIIELGEKWQYSEEYMRFFWELGKYINSYKGNISVFVSYITQIIPMAITSGGIIDDYLENFKVKNKNEQLTGNEFQPGDEISFKDGDQWRVAKVIAVEYFEAREEIFNPYLKIEVRRPKNEKFLQHVPHNLWSRKVRLGGIVTNSRGRSNLVTFNDRISEILVKRYGSEIVNSIRINPKQFINIIGRGADKEIQKLQHNIQFGDEKGFFMLSDLLYFDSDRQSNYVNVHVVNSQLSKPNRNSDSISLFNGSKRGIDFDNFKTRKNIYFTSRIKQNYLEDSELLINQFKQRTTKNHSQQLQEIEKLKTYMKNRGIGIPKGVELFVY